MAKDDLTVITGIHFSKSMLKLINGVTYIYDPTWNPNDYSYPTLPACFFHVKKMNEVMTSEVSQKTMLFYNSQKESSVNSSNSSAVLNVVADNIVVKPKVYKLDVIIPYENLTLLSSSLALTLNTVPAVLTTQITGSADKAGWTSYVAPYLSMSQASYGKALFNIIKQTANINFDDNTLAGIMGTSDYNKHSLEAMWRSRKIVKLKTWDNWNYKYVAITDIDITKEGTDDGVYEASITVQEVPIMTIHDTTGSKFATFNGLTSVAGEGVKKAMNKAGNLLGSKWG